MPAPGEKLIVPQGAEEMVRQSAGNEAAPYVSHQETAQQVPPPAEPSGLGYENMMNTRETLHEQIINRIKAMEETDLGKLDAFLRTLGK